ncbi:MAG: tryptophan synthase subunit alpha [Acidimicrobiales bacterium]|jgi:tryptophan synthase alpha chain
MKSLERDLRAVRDGGRKLLVPYFMGGLTDDWTEHVAAAVLAGADAVEIGIPFSDPMMDGPVIQEADLRALERGTTFDSVCDDLARLDSTVPLIAMTYYNIVLHYGLDRSAGKLAASGMSGAIVPDLALEETAPWTEACDGADVATILLFAPSTPEERVDRLAARTQGFAYASARMAVTGKSVGGGEGERVVRSIRRTSDVPALVGIGIATPDQAKAAAEVSDGVIVGSALVQVVLDGGGAPDIEAFIREFRDAIDQ